MSRAIIAAVLLLIASPAFAKDITLTLTEQDQKAFIALLDAALKAGGLQNLGAVNSFVAKYQQAAKEQAAPAPEAAPAPDKPKD